MEAGTVDDIFSDAYHPYTLGLHNAFPSIEGERGELTSIPGSPPTLSNPPAEYSFEDGRFRELMDLRQDLEGGAKRIETVLRREDGDGVMALREEYFSGTFVDNNAESVVDEALAAVVDGNRDRAVVLLAEEFDSVCETNHPDYYQTEDGIYVACHLYHDGW
jgi:peptide/nickel transport system ATP-binding protein